MPHTRTHEGQSLKSALSDLVVRTMQDYTGRGATRARTLIEHDTVMVVLEDILTKGERVLVSKGKSEEVLRIRRTFQDAMRDDLCQAVEQLTGRHVEAFMSTNHTEPDYAVEIFMLGDLIVGDAPPSDL
ncbi:MAG: Na-translocating system protein MpsC family protein [Patulibacter sp.]